MKVLVPEESVEAPDYFANERTSGEWERDDLTPMVEANANVRVRCPWMQGAVMTLSEAMHSYPGSITEEGQDIVIAQILDLLADPVIEVEEWVKEDNPQKEEQEEPETPEGSQTDKVEQAKKEEEPADKNTAKSEDKSEQPKETMIASQGVKKEGEVPTTIDPINTSTEAQASTITEANNQAAVKAEANAQPSVPESSGAVETVAGFDKEPHVMKPSLQAKQAQKPANKLIKTEKIVEPENVPPSETSRKQIETMDLPKTHYEPEKLVEQPAEQALITGQEPSVAEVELAEPEAVKELLHAENFIVSEEVLELEEDAAIEVVYELNPPEDRLEDGLVQFTEAEILIEHPEEKPFDMEDSTVFEAFSVAGSQPNLELEQTPLAFKPGDEFNAWVQMDITSPERPARTDLDIQKVESLLIQLTERIGADQPETNEKVNETLDKILVVPEKLAANNGENFATEAEAQEELEELFTRLLDEMGIDHTPKLIESLVHLTLRPHFADKIKELENQEEIDQVPQDSGTHEIIKQLLMSLSNIKQTMHACAIGRYALQQGCGLAFGFM